MKSRWLLLCFLCSGLVLFAQEGSVPAFEYLRDHRADLGLEASDLAELRIIDDYASPSGVRHVYVAQLLYGTPVYNAQAAVHFREGKAVYYTTGFEAGLYARSQPTAPALRAREALLRSAAAAGARLEAADLVYFPLPASPAIRLAWQLTVEDTDAATYTLFIVDAVSGDLLYEAPLTLHCSFGGGESDAPGGAAGAVSPGKQPAAGETAAGDGALYHVFPFGVESPLFGDRTLVAEPADPEASPYGWHDTDAAAGPEYTYTRGNNAYAYRDADADKNRPDSAFVADGGPFLDFDFPFAARESPDAHVEASLTQLFYLSNSMHDWTYRHGFDEAAGNFQENTYGRGGKGEDAVLAEAQDGAGSNNANFSTLSDGRPGRLQMFLWNGPSYSLDVTAPAQLVGDRLTGTAAFGQSITLDPITGGLVVGMDASGTPTLGCGPLVNTDAVRGKVVLLDRGDCAFQDKAYYAEQAGAIGVIICNTANSVITMGKSGSNPVTIPALMLGRDDCAALRAALDGGARVTVSLSEKESVKVDGSFDSGVVAHEYAHGVSTRLVGGPQTSTCLLNDEQMGEGWSDFFLLASTPHAAGDRPDGTDPRGIGLYSTSGFPGERGFRTLPYSTDLRINDHTYDDVITAAVPHGLGETWGSVLWDIYWKMVEAYGFDEDLIGGTGGNNAAVRLVIEAMKYTPCRPGLVDGRDALLAADRLENGGANQCLLWEAFRRRGLGFSATQGISDLRDDNREAFDPNPACLLTLKLAKSAGTAVIAAGDPLTFTLTLRNDQDTPVTSLRITDELPAGTTLDPTSVSGVDSYASAPGSVLFTLDDLPAGAVHAVSYSVTTDPAVSSTRLFYDGMEGEQQGAWTVIDRAGNQSWTRSDTTPYAGNRGWYLPNVGSVQDHILLLRDSVRITGSRPALRFFTKYRTEAAYDAGIVQVSIDGITWENIDERFERYGYRGFIDPRAPEDLQGTPTFWGDSEGYREVIVNLRDYIGETIFIRWRFVSDKQTPAGGWWIDEVELLSDLRTYDGEAVVTAAEGDRATARAAELGVVINSSELLDRLEIAAAANASVRVFPNPASEGVTVSLQAAAAGMLTIELWTVDGRRLWSRIQTMPAGENLLRLSLGEIPSGIYTLRIVAPGATTTARLTVTR